MNTGIYGLVVNFVSALLFLTRGLYPTVILYLVYGVMSFAGWWNGERQ